MGERRERERERERIAERPGGGGRKGCGEGEERGYKRDWRRMLFNAFKDQQPRHSQPTHFYKGNYEHNFIFYSDFLRVQLF